MKKVLGIICMITASVALGASCGDDASSPSVARGEFVNELAAVVCARAYDCCPSDELQQILDEVGATNEEECRTNYAVALASEFESALTAVEVGTMAYQGSQAGACLQALSGLACSEGILGNDAGSAACEKIFVGNVAQGDDCRNSSECVAGACIGVEYDDNYEIIGAGTCTPFVPNGASCQSGEECAEGSTCNLEYDDETGEYVGTCEAYRAIGESCDYNDCVFGAYCDMPTATETGVSTGTCKAEKADGEACEDFDECQSWTCEAPAGDPDGQKVCVSDDDALTCAGK